MGECCRGVVAAVGVSPDADFLVGGGVVGEVLEPDLGKVPEGMGGLGGVVYGVWEGEGGGRDGDVGLGEGGEVLDGEE